MMLLRNTSTILKRWYWSYITTSKWYWWMVFSLCLFFLVAGRGHLSNSSCSLANVLAGQPQNGSSFCEWSMNQYQQNGCLTSAPKKRIDTTIYLWPTTTVNYVCSNVALGQVSIYCDPSGTRNPHDHQSSCREPVAPQQMATEPPGLQDVLGCPGGWTHNKVERPRVLVEVVSIL